MGMLVNRGMERDWQSTDKQGVERCVFRANEHGGKSQILRMKKGTHFVQHVYEGNTEFLLLSGQVLVGGVELIKGDYLFAKAGEQHDIVALSQAELYVNSEQAMTLVT